MQAHRIAALVERLALADIDVEPERCDTGALRSTARDMLALADLLDASDDEDGATEPCETCDGEGILGTPGEWEVTCPNPDCRDGQVAI